MGRLDIDFKRAFAVVTRREHEYGDARDCGERGRHMAWWRGADQSRQHRPGFRPGNRDRGIMLLHIERRHAQVRAEVVADVGDERRHPVCATGRTRQQIAMFGQAPDGTIVKHEPVFAEHERIAPAPDRKLADRRRANDFKESGDIGPAHFELGER